MATFPSSLDYSFEGYSYTVNPDVNNYVFSSRNTRQRKMSRKRDDVFNVRMRLDETELQTFEDFVDSTISGGADTYTGPYYTSDSEYTGTLYIVEGNYNVSYVAVDYWDVSFQMELKDRVLTEEKNIYEVVNEHSGFETTYNALQALEDMMNNNTLS